MWLFGAIPREHDKSDLARMQHLDPFLLRDKLAAWWNYAGDGYEVAVLNPRITEGQFETGQVLLMFSNAFRHEEIFRDHF